MELRDYASTILKWWRIIVVGTALSIAISFGIGKAITSYEVTNTLQATLALEPINIYEEVVQKSEVLEDVIDNLELSYTQDELAKMIEVEEVENSRYVKIIVKLDNAVMALDINNELSAIIIKERTLYQVDQIAYDLSVLENQKTATLAQLNAAISPEEKAPLQETYISILNTISALDSQLNEIHPDENTYNSLAIYETPTLELVYANAKPKINLVMGIGAILGLALFIAVAFLLDYFLNKVETLEEISEITGLPILGKIKKVRDPWMPNSTSSDKQNSSLEDSFWILNTNLALRTKDKPAHSIMITSTRAHEGKTTILANLACVMANMGKRVVVVDTNMRNPRLHQLFNTSKEPGLAEHILSENSIQTELIKPTEIEGVRIITSGSLPANASRFMSSPQFSTILETLQQEGDIILFDSPAMLSVADSKIIASQIDGVILVVEARKTRIPNIRGIKEKFSKDGIDFIGVVLNKSD
ncbi:polysaccharide biosynthesis tyrosine autokinase [Chloroflexota bacterium]